MWKKVRNFLDSQDQECILEIRSDEDLWIFFEDYKYIEAAGGLVQRDNKFLFIKRNGYWDIPKGKLDKGERPEQAAVREIEEECGLIAPVIKTHLIDTYHTYPGKKKKILKRTYWYWLEEGAEKTELIPQIEEGITAVEYLGEEEFGKVLDNTFLSIVDVIDALEKRKAE